MKRYVVPAILAVWAVSIALGCASTIVWVLLLAVAIPVQAVELGRVYRDHHRRRL